jgi:large subunit ribosomal protein L4
MVLSDKVRNDLLVVIDDFSLESHKTKNFVDTLKQFGLSGKVLLVDDRENQNLFLGSRNLPNVKMVPTTGVNVYDLLNHRHLLISKQAVQKLDEVLRPS